MRGWVCWFEEREGVIESEHIHLDSKTHQSIVSSMRAVGEGEKDVVLDYVLNFVWRVMV